MENYIRMISTSEFDFVIFWLNLQYLVCEHAVCHLGAKTNMNSNEIALVTLSDS